MASGACRLAKGPSAWLAATAALARTFDARRARPSRRPAGSSTATALSPPACGPGSARPTGAGPFTNAATGARAVGPSRCRPADRIACAASRCASPSPRTLAAGQASRVVTTGSRRSGRLATSAATAAASTASKRRAPSPRPSTRTAGAAGRATTAVAGPTRRASGATATTGGPS